jgi:pyruvate formate lyase activating enzyme
MAKNEAQGKEAWFYAAYPDGRVRCTLCAHFCVIAPGRTGACHVRYNQEGTLLSLVYGHLISEHVDPIEKKPLFHFYPGSMAYSIATPGCNFRCRWCQNWDISQMPRLREAIYGYPTSPQEVVARARAHGCRSISYTYTEPTIFYEFAYDTMRRAVEQGLANNFVTNGYMGPDPLKALKGLLHAANVDLKSFRNKTYQRYMGARLEPILDNLKAMKAMGVWVEVTTLVIPQLNDDPGELKDIAAFIAQELGPETPWHISRFFPTFRMTDRPPTPAATLRRARQLGLEQGLHYVYLGNLRAGEGEDTHCHQCGALLIRRLGFSVLENRVQAGNCPDCGTAVAGVGMSSERELATGH